MPNHPLQFQNWYLSHSEHFQEQTSIEYVGTPEFGINHLIYHQLSGMEAPIWFEITPRVAHDPVLTANTLVDAFNKAAGERLLDHGMQYPYVLNIIKKYTPLFGAHTFVFSGTHLAPEFARAMLELKQEGHTLILIGEERLSDLPILTNEDLRVTRSEAFQLAEPLMLSEPQIQDAYDQTRGVFEPLWIRLNELARRPIPLRPTADGFKHPPGYEVDLDPKLLVSLLRKKEKHMEALEIAVPNCPHLVPQFIEEAGSRALLTGAHAHLHVLLEALPREIKEDEVVMRWRIEAACLNNKKDEIKKEVMSYLEVNEAPDVRAVSILYFINNGNIKSEIDRVYRSRKSIFTLKAKAFGLLYEREVKKEDELILFESLSLAEKEENKLEMLRCARIISTYSSSRFNFRDYLYWSQYALDLMKEMENLNSSDKLEVINSWLYARIITGEVDSIESILNVGNELCVGSRDDISAYFENTRADYWTIKGLHESAIGHWKNKWEKADRNYKAYYCFPLVRSLLCGGYFEIAGEYVDKTLAITKGVPSYYRIHAMCANALLQLKTDPSRALVYVEENLSTLEVVFHPTIYLVNNLIGWVASIKLEKPDKVAEYSKYVKFENEKIKRGITKYYLGDLDYVGAFSLEISELSLNLMGEEKIYINNRLVKLPLRQIEILSILAMNPNGLSGEKLLMEVYGDSIDQYGSLKTSISKLRKIISVESNPYKLSCKVKCDFIDLIEYIKNGDIEAALNIYNGNLLVRSDAEGIISTRRYIEMNLRNLIIESKNIENHIKYYEKNKNDVEIIESLLDLIQEHDPRRAIFQFELDRLIGAD